MTTLPEPPRSVTEAFRDLSPVFFTAEKDSEDCDLGRRFINFKVIDEFP